VFSLRDTELVFAISPQLTSGITALYLASYAYYFLWEKIGYPIFFYSDNPDETKEWYTKNLGIEINDWGSSSFESRNIDNPGEINSLQWKPFKNGDEYFLPSKKNFMINYQVQNIEGLVKKLKENGVTILDSITAYDGIGKFVHIMDAEDNKIELWEPEN
jgi:predicted enzyme related to lactoylglutathione lyase